MSKFLSILLLLFFIQVRAQDESFVIDSPFNNLFTFTTKSSSYANEVQGSPYLQEEFKRGGVYKNNELLVKVKMRFNAHRGEMEFIGVNDSIYILGKAKELWAELDSRNYKILLFKNKIGQIRNAYFNKLNEGNLKLLFKPQIDFRKGKESYDSYRPKVRPAFIKNSSYYAKIGDNPANKINLNRKNVLKLLSKEKEEMLLFVKKNKLDLRTETDVIRLFTYYNSL
ncbi:MAG: hypothetical protein AAF575_00960 [Bacteroidota bacterium]